MRKCKKDINRCAAEKTTPTGLEPVRKNSNRFLVDRLNHSAKVSLLCRTRSNDHHYDVQFLTSFPKRAYFNSNMQRLSFVVVRSHSSPSHARNFCGIYQIPTRARISVTLPLNYNQYVQNLRFLLKVTTYVLPLDKKSREIKFKGTP